VGFGREFEGEGPQVGLFCEASSSWAVSWSRTAVLNEVPVMFTYETRPACVWLALEAGIRLIKVGNKNKEKIKERQRKKEK